MGKQTISSDSFETWGIFGTHGVWTLEVGVELYVADNPAVWLNGNARGNTINILGDIINTGADAIGIAVFGSRNRFFVGEDASITAQYGISGPGTHTEVDNRGTISATLMGLAFDGPTEIRNSGMISAIIGVMVDNGSSVVNTSSGRIVGFDVGVVFDAGVNRLVNNGAIAGGTYSLVNDGRRATIINNGRLDGDVLLGIGSDYFDTRNGTINGRVFGSLGDDTFVLSNARTRIVEYGGEGTDTVESTASYTLGNNLNRLILLGNADLDGSGNALPNVLQGNAGDNLIHGMAGVDTLSGGLGTDRQRGGTGADTFVFNKGDQTEIVMDYIDEIDTIAILDTRFSSFRGLSRHIEDHGADTWILLGGDDRIVLKGVDHSVLERTDFEFTTL